MSLLQKITSVGRTKYDGPKNFEDIIKAIKKEFTTNVTEQFIRDVIYATFSSRGLAKIFLKHRYFKLKFIGHFSPRVGFVAPERPRKIISIEEKRRKKNYIMKLYRIRKRLIKINKKRREINLKPLTFTEYARYIHPDFDIRDLNRRKQDY